MKTNKDDENIHLDLRWARFVQINLPWEKNFSFWKWTSINRKWLQKAWHENFLPASQIRSTHILVVWQLKWIIVLFWIFLINEKKSTKIWKKTNNIWRKSTKIWKKVSQRVPNLSKFSLSKGRFSIFGSDIPVSLANLVPPPRDFNLLVVYLSVCLWVYLSYLII